MANSFNIRNCGEFKLDIYTLMKLKLIKLHGGYLSLSLHEFLCI